MPDAVFSEIDAAALRFAAEAGIDYRKRLETGVIPPAKDYAAKLRDFDEPLPENGQSSENVIRSLNEKGGDGILDISSPRYFGYVMGGGHPAAVAADMLTAVWNQNTAMMALTPTTCAIEEVVRRWLLDLFDLPRTSSLGICTGATMANAVGLAAARNEMLRREGWDVEANGLFGAPEVHVIVGAQAHSSIGASLRLIGFGASRVHTVAVDGQGRMLPGDLEAVISACAGPKIIIAQAGNINSGAIDPMNAIADIAAAAQAWLHVDGAFGLWARIHPDLKEQIAGVERADSWALDGHKWLQVTYDCGLVLVRDMAAHARAMGHAAAYLPNSATLHDPGDFVPELSRRARGIPTWAVLKALGRAGIVEIVGRDCRLARKMADALAAEPGISVLNEVRLNQVALAFGAAGNSGDAQTAKVLARVQAEGVCYPSHGLWKGRKTMRLSVCGYATDDTDADRTVSAIITAWRACQLEAA